MIDHSPEEALFLAAREIQDRHERAAFLQRACARDEQLRARMEELLRLHDQPQGPLDAPPPGLSSTWSMPEARELPGTQIGPYKLREQIGEGGFGIVYVAEQEKPVRRKVALKIIKPGMDTRDVIARFEAERQALALMDHPNIARVLDAGNTAEVRQAFQTDESAGNARQAFQTDESAGNSRQAFQTDESAENARQPFQTDARLAGDSDAVPCSRQSRKPDVRAGRPYFVMELVHGVKITEFCDKNRLPMRQRLELLVDICRAVQHAHHKGIIHRDLKPSNILVTLHDGKPVPKVIDFGVSKALSQQLTEKTIYTAYGQMIGTPEYMSPEQAEMSGLGIDTRSDIYSLGVLLYELLTGRPPFDAMRLRQSGYEAMLRIIREEEPLRPSTKISTMGAEATIVADHRRTDVNKLRQSLRGDLDWIVMKALEKDRSRRYETVNGFAADVERFLNDQPVEACPPSTVYKLRKFARRNKGPVMAAAALLLVLFLGLIGTTLGLVRAQAEAARALAAEEEATEGRNRVAEAYQRADQASRAERRLNFHMAFDRGISLCEQGHVGSGMLWLAHALEIAPAEESAMVRVIRANLRAWRRELHTLEGIIPHEQGVTAVAYSPDGNFVFTGTVNGVTEVWNRHSQTRKFSLQAHDGEVHEFAFSPDGSSFLTASYDESARLWEMSSGELIRSFPHDSTVYGALFTPDGRIVTSTAGGKVFVWDPEDSQTPVRVWPFAQHAVHDIALSPHGKRIVAAIHDGTALVWDLKQEQPIAKFTGHTGHTGRVATADFIGPNRIASGDTDGNLLFWTWTEGEGTAKGEILSRPWRHRGGVHRLRVSEDGKWILTASFDNNAQLLHAESGDPIGAPFEHQAGLHSVATSRDGRILTACGDNNARQWRPAPGSLRDTIVHKASSQPAIYSPDALYVIIRKADGTASVYKSMSRDERIGEPIRPTGGIQSLAVSLDESRVMTGGADGIVRCWETATGKALGETSHHGTAVWGVVFSRDGQRAYSGGLDGVVNQWDARTGTPLDEPLLTLGRHSVRGMGSSPDGSRLAVTTSAKELLLVDAATGRVLRTLPGHKDMVMPVAFSRDGKFAVTGSFDNTVVVWNVETGDKVSTPMRHEGPIWYSVAFNSDGSAVVTACEDRTARVWDVATGKPIGPRLPHEATLRAVAFMADDAQIVTGTATGVTRVWDVSSKRIEGDVERIKLWLQVSTGMELDTESGEVRVLDPQTWQERRTRLDDLGGPPIR